MKKRLLYFVPQFPVLSETFIEREISKIVSLDYFDVTVLSLARGSGTASENILDKILYKRIGLFDCIVGTLLAVFKFPKRLKKAHDLIAGDDRVPYFFNFKKDASARTQLSVVGRFHNARFVHFLKGVAYYNIFRKLNPDHVHIHFLSDNSTVGMVACTLLDVPFSISAHAKDVFVEGTLIPVKAREAKFISVCNGNTWKEVVKYANLTKSSGKVKLAYHGIDPNKFFDVELPLKESVPTMLTIARLTEKKGLQYLIEASKILKDRNVPHKIKIIGGGPLRDELLSQISTLNLDEYVDILSGTDNRGLPNAQVAGYLQVSDIYVAPFIEASDGDVDGVPTTVIEAAYAKLPIIATNAGSMSDLVTSKTGIIVAQKSPEQIADAIERILNDSELSQQLVEASYMQVKRQFNIDTNIEELATFIGHE